MNELIAILLCVFVCCGMFLLWLVSMATCPDRMVNLISGGGGGSKTSSSSSRNESCELVSSSKDEESGEYNSEAGSPVKEMDSLQFCKAPHRSNSKKLSVVPEQDEQLTLQSIKFPIRPTIYDDEEVYSVPSNSSGTRLISRFSESHIDQYEIEDEMGDDEILQPPQSILLQPVTLPARIPANSGGPVAVSQPYSQIGDRFFKCYSVGYVNQPDLR